MIMLQLFGISQDLSNFTAQNKQLSITHLLGNIFLTAGHNFRPNSFIDFTDTRF